MIENSMRFKMGSTLFSTLVSRNEKVRRRGHQSRSTPDGTSFKYVGLIYNAKKERREARLFN